jgi:3-oxoacyl-[acyl-carrier-protein] synthase-3
VADNFIRSGSASNVLVVASEIFSQIVNWKDRSTCVLFGDGAAAVVITRSSDSSGIIDYKIHSDGAYGDLLTTGGVASRRPGVDTAMEDAGYFIEMKGNQTFKVAVKRMTDVSSGLLEKNGFSVDDVDIVIPHQANIRIINAVGKSLGVPEEKVFVNVDRYGNTSAASIPIAMYEAVKEGQVKSGDLVLLVAFGGGLTWGSTLIRW